MIRWSKIALFFIGSETIFLVFLLFIAFVYRIWFAGLAYPDVVFDMDRYVAAAINILDGKIVADCCDKTAGYPMFLAGVFGYSGRNNFIAVRFVQIILELVIILFVFKISKIQFGKVVAYVSAVLYAINPFTSSYTGLLLPEIITVFILVLIAYLLTLQTFNKKIAYWFVYGLLFGVLVFVRKQYLYVFIVTTILILIYLFRHYSDRIRFLLLIIFGFFIASSYSLLANYQTFQRLTVIPPYQPTGLIYVMYFLEKPYPELLLNSQDFESIYYEIGQAWYSVPLSQRDEVNNKYINLFFQKLPSDWPVLLKNYVRNMYWIWDRYHFFYYFDKWFPGDVWIARSINWLYMISALMGIGFYIWRRKKKFLVNTFSLFTMAALFVSTFVFTLVSSEARHTLALFGIITVWASYGIVNVLVTLPFRKLIR